MCVPSWITPRGYSTEWSKKWESAVITARPRRAAPRHAASVGIDRAERQKIIPANEDPGGLASLQGSRINDLGAMIFRILRGNTVRRFNVFPGRSPWISRAREPCRVNEYMHHDWNETLWRRLHGSGSIRFRQTNIEMFDRKLYAARKRCTSTRVFIGLRLGQEIFSLYRKKEKEWLIKRKNLPTSCENVRERPPRSHLVCSINRRAQDCVVRIEHWTSQLSFLNHRKNKKNLLCAQPSKKTFRQGRSLNKSNADIGRIVGSLSQKKAAGTRDAASCRDTWKTRERIKHDVVPKRHMRTNFTPPSPRRERP